jgi:genome maintenance exonuclease 1
MKKFIHRDDVGDFEVPEIKVIDGKRHYVTPDGNSYPSITTILSQQDNPGIEAWKAKVGEKEAKRISKESMRIGTAVHQMAEFYISNYIIKLKDEDKKIVDTFNRLRFLLGNINNIVGLEIPLFSDLLRVAGTTDKKEEWIDDYYMQTFAYKLMFEEMTGIEIQQIVILVACVESFDVQVFKKPAKDADEWLEKLVKIMKNNPHVTGMMHQPF